MTGHLSTRNPPKIEGIALVKSVVRTVYLCHYGVMNLLLVIFFTRKKNIPSGKRDIADVYSKYRRESDLADEQHASQSTKFTRESLSLTVLRSGGKKRVEFGSQI